MTTVNKLIGAALVAAPFAVGSGVYAEAALQPNGPNARPSDVHADGGVPVQVDGETLYLYGDTITDDGRFHHSSVLLPSGELLVDVLPAAPNGGWYWLADARQVDGTLRVFASELERDSSSWFGFRAVDTDVFVVRDPSNRMSWRLAEHVDAGWWDGYNVRYVTDDQMAVRARDSDTTFWYLPDSSEPVGVELGESDGVIAPVQFDGAWLYVSWSMSTGTVDLWRNGDVIDSWQHEPDTTYGHSLAVIDGELVHYWSTFGGTVTYDVI